ncbi:zinc metalloproteinase nas-14 [Zeugodacus cucurbitae]|uniref:zinc metalloproteinase nas-14 n=1 Tax=Zeugodacus cucurbitae TaxID=28588 RepID=UPI0023D8E798|nr:zinc metalloproteinase nas-14 [Zeugodacus cucurbitae]
MRTFLSLAMLSVIGASRALPVDPPMEDSELNPLMRVSQRSVVRDSDRRWPNGIVYYKFWNGFDNDRKTFIKGAMKSLEDVSCIRFVEAGADQPYFVNITGSSGTCNRTVPSTVGFEKGITSCNLPGTITSYCYTLGRIQHELFHVLGFYHLQQIYNRDDYVRIVNENIIKGREYSFTKFSKDLVDDFGVEYDYGSIMHSSPDANGKNSKDTIVPLQKIPKGLMGQREVLQQSDIIKLNRMYECTVCED